MPPLDPPERLKRASSAAYVRVSTLEQDFQTQRAAIERAASARGDGDLVWYGETRSGRSWVRPELDRLQRNIFQGFHPRVYVFKLDRLTRRGIPDTFEVVQQFRKCQCQLISVTEGFDFAGPAGDLLVAMLAFGAQHEMSAQMERQAAARARLESEGKTWGRPPIDLEKRAKIRALRAEGRSVRSISMALKVPKSTVFDALK